MANYSINFFCSDQLFNWLSGNCASCHAPGAALDGFQTTNMNAVRDMVTAGVHCDFCHKVGGVYLDPANGSIYPNAPNVNSLQVLRPPQEDQIFFGPFDDIPDPDTYLPLIRESQFCAPCHQFSFWGTPIYESYNEWLASPYVEQGVTCQNCHMLPTGDSYFALPEVGGLPHPPESIPSHLQPGASSLELLQDTVSMNLQTEQIGQQLWVTVIISNTNAGHHVPTDHPGRHLILIDNRIAAFAADSSRYAFTLPSQGGQVTIQAELLFRRNFQAEMDARGWQEADIPMEVITQQLSISSAQVLFIPIVRR